MSIFSPDTLVIFTTSPTGLGHIRVMDALVDGLSLTDKHTVVGVKDVGAAKIHALGSRNPLLLSLTEFIQTNPVPETIVTFFYKKYFSSRTKFLGNELVKTAQQFPDKKTWIIISTHFALAYPVVSIKKSISQKLGVKIFNAVVVTDDSPQRIWAVDGSDIIFAPSKNTSEKLRSFLGKNSQTQIETVSFPVSPRLTQPLSIETISLIQNQLDPKKREALHLLVPVSGAAVQLDYLYALISELSKEKFVFTVIGKDSPFATNFFDNLKKIARVQLSIGANSHETVNLYESTFYQALRPAVEITKPSEQTFKAILKPGERGGVILLLTDPVGRQERDNLNFLIRHSLLATHVEQKQLEKYLLIDGKLPESEVSAWHYKASHWRTIKLPSHPNDSAIFIKRLKEVGLLQSMLSYVASPESELTSDGVSQIWNKIFELVK